MAGVSGMSSEEEAASQNRLLNEKLENALDVERREKERVKETLQKLEKDKKKLKNDRDTQRDRAKNYETLLNNTKEAIEKLQDKHDREIQTLEKKVAELNEINHRREMETTEQKRELEKSQKEKQALAEKAHDLEQKVKSFVDERNLLTGQVERLQSHNTDLRNQLHECEELKDRLRQIINPMRTPPQTVEQTEL